MSELNIVKFSTKRNNLSLNVAMGHFAGSNSHSNYFIDVVSQKTCLSEARAVAKELCADYYYSNTSVDTVVCLDGTEVIGACLADRLSKPDLANINSQKSIYVVTPETTASGQFLFSSRSASTPTLGSFAAGVRLTRRRTSSSFPTT